MEDDGAAAEDTVVEGVGVEEGDSGNNGRIILEKQRFRFLPIVFGIVFSLHLPTHKNRVYRERDDEEANDWKWKQWD